MKACVYVDGFNLYYRAIKRTPFKWLNLHEMATHVLDPADEIVAIRYFTADISPKAGDSAAPARQQAYLKAIRTLPGLTVHKGRFLQKTKTRPLVSDPTTFVEVHDTEEKGSDVNLAAHLLNDAFRGRFDVALIVSQDSDLLEPMRMVCRDLGKVVGIAWLDQTNPGKKYKAVSSFIRHVSRTILRDSQFPNPVIRPDGSRISKPAQW